MTKKVILALCFILALAVTAYAVKTLTLSSSQMHKVEIFLSYDEKGDWDAEVWCYGDKLDDLGVVVDDMKLEQSRAQMPSDVRNSLDNFLKHMSREFNIRAADEDKETLKSAVK